MNKIFSLPFATWKKLDSSWRIISEELIKLLQVYHLRSCQRYMTPRPLLSFLAYHWLPSGPKCLMFGQVYFPKRFWFAPAHARSSQCDGHAPSDSATGASEQISFPCNASWRFSWLSSSRLALAHEHANLHYKHTLPDEQCQRWPVFRG